MGCDLVGSGSIENTFFMIFEYCFFRPFSWYSFKLKLVLSSSVKCIPLLCIELRCQSIQRNGTSILSQAHYV